MNRIFWIVSLFAVVGACASTPRAPEFKAREVIERIGDADETPKWTTGAVPMVEEGSNVLYSFAITLSGDSRTDSCLSIAEIKAKSNILDYIRSNLTSSGQVSEQGQNDPAYEALIAFYTSGKLSGVKTVDRYWERSVESDANGNRVLRIKCAARVSIAKSELERQLRDKMASKGNAEIREKLVKAQGDFIEALVEEENK